MSLLKEDVEVLREVPIFASVDPSKLKLLAFASQRLKFDSGQILCKEGEVGDKAFVIVKGSADVYVRAGNDQVKVATVTRNDFIGTWRYCATGRAPRPCRRSARAKPW